MKYSLVIGLMAFFSMMAQAQQVQKEDDHYREDQFYLGLTYNYLVNRPSELQQQGFSKAVQVGFLRDMPLNKRRNIALALGVGYEYANAYTNVLALRHNNQTQYYLADSTKSDYSYSGFQTHTVEIPIEFRYRTSTATSYKFYRVYTGVKFSYVFSSDSFYQFQDLQVSFNNTEISTPWQAKAYISMGYNTWNVFVQYVISPLFDKAYTASSKPLKMNMLQIGIIFYIL